MVNGDCQSKTVRADPLNGRVREILVDGSFQEAYTLKKIRANPNKNTPIHYHITQDNGTAAAFIAYVEKMIADKWFEPYDVLIMENAAIHTRREASIIEDLLWNQCRVIVVPLPAHAPERNLIELVFHILAKRLRSNKYRVTNLS